MSFLIGIIAGSAGGAGVGTILQPALEKPRQELMGYYKPTLPSPAEAVNLRYRGFLDEKQYYATMLKHGYDEGVASALWQGSRPQLAIQELINLKRRGLIEQKLYEAYAFENGFAKERLALVEKALEFYPQVGDLIRFAVREGYTPDIVEKFKLDEDLPPKFIEEAAKAGLSKENATLFWRAHWELPSVQAGYEMLHRGLIEIKDLELLLRTADVMPFWRDKLIAIAQTPFTRVDVRRMYKLGVLNYSQVIKSYKDIGYAEDKALQLAEFTVKDIMEEERDLTKAEIVKLYGYQEIKREGAVTMLLSMGYSDIEADLILATQDLKQQTADTTEQIKSYTDQFVNNLIDEEAFKEVLAHLSLKGDAGDRIFKNALIKKLKAIQRLEKADVLNVFKKELINRDEALKRLRILNYTEADSELLLKAVAEKVVKK